MPSRKWAHDLAVGIAATFDWFDAPKVVDEALLARAIRQVVTECDDLGYSLLLRSVADALDHPNALRRLRLGRAKSGRPNSGELFDRALMVGPYVTKRLREGVKKESAIQEAMDDFGLSRSAVMRSTSDYEKYRLVFDRGQRETNSRTGMHDAMLAADETKARSLYRANPKFKKAGD